jgi:enoyl-CoA hydratase/carnithine racemase
MAHVYQGRAGIDHLVALGGTGSACRLGDFVFLSEGGKLTRCRPGTGGSWTKEGSMSDSFDDAVVLTIDGPLATVSLNRPDRLNAWSWEMGAALHRRMEEVAENREVRAVLLHGNGRAFCSGIDLKPDVRERIVGRSPAERLLNHYHRYRGSHRRTQFIEEIPQPIVVALHGYCLGAGFEIAMLGDVRIAAEGTVFGCPEAKIGVAIDCGLDMRLAMEVGPAWAKWMTLSGRRFDAATAYRLGLLQEVHPVDSVLDEARKLAAEIAENAPLAVQATKRTIDMFAKRGLTEALRFEALNAAACFVSEDLIEGFAAGREKRKTRFEGK